MRRAAALWVLSVMLIATVMSPPLAVGAYVPVGDSDLVSSRSTPGSTTPDGSTGLAYWSSSYGGFKLWWNITATDPPVPVVAGAPQYFWWKYEYTVTGDTLKAGGNLANPADYGSLAHDLSHILIQVTSQTDNPNNWFGAGEIYSPTGGGTFSDPKTYTANNSHNGSIPELPATVWAIKYGPPESSASHFTFSFVSNHEPVWGNFYAKDGVGGGSDHLTDPTVVWNDGITLTTPYGAYPDENVIAAHPTIPWVAVPDGVKKRQPDNPPDVIPEPTGLVIWSILGGGAAALTALRRRRAGADARARWSDENRAAIHDLIARGRHWD